MLETDSPVGIIGNTLSSFSTQTSSRQGFVDLMSFLTEFFNWSLLSIFSPSIKYPLQW